MQTLLQSRIAVISGGAGYIGSAIARRLSEDGFRVIILYHRTVPDAILLKNGAYQAFQCDLRQENAMHDIMQKITNEHGRIDVCVHAAETAVNRSPLLDLTSQELVQQFEVGLFGGFYFLRTAAKYMPTGGTMLGITSIHTEPEAYASKIGAYIPAKLALRGLLRVLHRELTPTNIRVHAIAPSFLPGGMNKDLPPAVAKLIHEKTTNGLSVHHVARIASFLCSPDAAHLNGLSHDASTGAQTPL